MLISSAVPLYLETWKDALIESIVTSPCPQPVVTSPCLYTRLPYFERSASSFTVAQLACYMVPFESPGSLKHKNALDFIRGRALNVDVTHFQTG